MAPMESSPESMRGASAAMVVPVTSAAIGVSSSRRAFCERVLSAFAGCIDLIRRVSDLGRDILPASVDFVNPTGTKSVSRKLALESGFVAFGSRYLENEITGGDIL